MKSSQKDSSQVKDMSMSPDSTRSSSDSSESDEEKKKKSPKTRSPRSGDKTRRSGSGKLKNPSPFILSHLSLFFLTQGFKKSLGLCSTARKEGHIMCQQSARFYLGVFTQTRVQFKNSVLFRFINWFLSQLTNWILLQFFVLSHLIFTFSGSRQLSPIDTSALASPQVRRRSHSSSSDSSGSSHSSRRWENIYWIILSQFSLENEVNFRQIIDLLTLPPPAYAGLRTWHVNEAFPLHRL